MEEHMTKSIAQRALAELPQCPAGRVMRAGAALLAVGAGLTLFQLTASAALSRTTLTASKISVTYLSPVAAQPTQQDIYYGIALGAKILGWHASVLDANLSASQQVTDAQTAINQHVTALSSYSLDPATDAGAYEAAQKRGIPVIGMGSTGTGLTASVFEQYVHCTPGTGIPEAEAQFIATRHPHARILIIGGPTTVQSIVEDTACFTADAKALKLNILATANNTGDSTSTGEAAAAPLITKYPNVQAIWDYNDTTALGASAALTSAGLKVANATSSTGVIVIGQNGDSDAIAAIRAKPTRLTMTVDPNSVAAGLQIIADIRLALAHKKVPTAVIRSTIYNSANIAQWKPPHDRGFTLHNIPLVK
jgi:ribose transport system substrate-binding protein